MWSALDINLQHHENMLTLRKYNVLVMEILVDLYFFKMAFKVLYCEFMKDDTLL